MKLFKFAFLSLFVSVLFINCIAQQNEEFPKLSKLYNEQKYEACLMKSEKLTYNDKTKREPLPYLFLSKSYYQLSLSDDPDIQEYYPKALKNALKYAIKFVQKDKRKVYVPQNTEYIELLTKTYIEKTQELYDNGKYNKVASNYKQLLKLKDDDNIRFAKGVCNAMNSNYSEASTYIGTALKNIRTKENKPNQLTDKLLVNYLIDYSDFLFRQEEADSALSTINIGLKLKPGNKSFEYQKEKLEKSIASMKKEENEENK
ncbi:MAG: hypothetical protein GXO79_03030 [Chlorobi bacterium]|nr:hypothetical protein [Chlorobiota bacterium]